MVKKAVQYILNSLFYNMKTTFFYCLYNFALIVCATRTIFVERQLLQG